MRISRALISVSDKTGIVPFVKFLESNGVEILSTGGTAAVLKKENINVIDVSEYTGFPEMLDGRVKTLHPKVHGGILARRDNQSHIDTITRHDIGLIDMVVVNLYPFEETVLKPDATHEEIIENIDIGGPTLLRSAAKNYDTVTVISSSDDYSEVMEDMSRNDCSVSDALRLNLVYKVFQQTARYEAAIETYFHKLNQPEDTHGFPKNINLNLIKNMDLRYGENPHQKGAFYKNSVTGNCPLNEAEVYQGKELSFNNILDLDSAMELICTFDTPAAAVIKHNNPAGVACASEITRAFIDALDCDRLSAFGGIMAFNRKIDKTFAEIILKESDFVECVTAPEIDKEALEVFSVKKNLRVLKCGYDMPGKNEIDYKCVRGGFLLQDKDFSGQSALETDIVTDNKPTDEEMRGLLFAWHVVQYVRSNAIVICNGTKTVGIGAGQMSRVDSVIHALRKSGDKLKNSVLASDAFFPKEDSIIAAGKAGIKAIIQPGGSIKDKDVIKACNDNGIAMVFTGTRHFKH